MSDLDRPSSACKHRVSGSLSLPSRGSFHLSLTVLFAIGHWVVFRLGGWAPLLQTGFHVSGPTLDPARFICISPTGLLPPSAVLSRTIRLYIFLAWRSPQPQSASALVWPLSRSLAATRKISVDFSSWGYLDVSVHPVPFVHLCIQCTMRTHCHTRVPPFGHLRVYGYVLLTAAFRSLSRPSSAPSAKASP